MISSATMATGKRIAMLVLLFELVSGVCSGAAFRLSFLDQESTLADTCQLLKQAGVSEESVSTFKKLVEHHNRHGNRVDKTNFPVAKGGFYEFRDLADFTNRLRAAFYLTPTDHSPDQDTFTCFDAACLLLYGAGCRAPDFEKNLNSKDIVLSKADPQTFRSEYHWALFPEKRYERLTGKARSEGETQLILSIRATRVLASPDATNDLAWRAGFTSYVRELKEGGFVFPGSFKLGLVFFAMPNGQFIADHAFLCIPNQGRLVCVEKASSPGPYVRTEFESEEDLARYISWSFLEIASNPKLKVPGTVVFVSLNDKLVGVYPTEPSTEGRKSPMPAQPAMTRQPNNILKANGQTASSLSDATEKGRVFLVSLFDPDLNLLPEYRGADVYWLFHDNYLAAKVLNASYPKTAGSIMAAIQREGSYTSGRMGLIFGEADKAWPFRQSQLVDVRRVGGKVIRTETESDRVFVGWEEYADLLLLACLTEEHQGHQSVARQHWESAMRLWDGNGFLDAAAKHDGRYSTYKLGLALLAASCLLPPVQPPQGLLNKLLTLQDNSGGWITDYDAMGKKIGLANVETTCLVILGIESSNDYKQRTGYDINGSGLDFSNSHLGVVGARPVREALSQAEKPN
ncbi:MAG: hypothetical protein ABSF60_04115 [Verrucomicrobiota bacterium]